MEYTAPKGVFDIVPFEPKEEDKWRESHRWNYLESILRQTANDYGYQEIRTPIFEKTELFVRSVGESSDIVSKEMYTFLDRAERSMTLRPEGTASAMRSFVENRLHQNPGLQKYFYIGPMFRYERQQAGRYRQHHQFGAEAIGIGKAEQDVELIDMVCEIYRRLGLKNLNVMINSVGDAASRTAYKEALASFLTPHFEQLSADSKVRFSKNILRILDSKDANDQKILEGAPTILDHLTPDAKQHFEQVLRLLDGLKLSYAVNPKLVRGLDYYNKTVFEITSGELGAQNSLGGGGRYDSLTASLGGPNLPSVGFATGLERILQTMIKQNAPFPEPPHPTLFIVPLGEASLSWSFELVCKLRHEHIRAEIDLSGKKVQQGLQLANQLQADFCLVIGDEELAQKTGKLKKMTTRESFDVSLDNLAAKLKELKG
ncbi:MAG: histidine--tRNA ligase [Parachlamydiales bacterium]|nr:histidine--tRNA ligase [Verrucomicrobiota bacterium]MBX3718499.1 histidine--tRNA ligase [Candidatus Acheromyda pituitae]